MKYLLILMATTSFAVDCLGQHHYTYYGAFSPQQSPFFRAPIGTQISLKTRIQWAPDLNPGPDFYPWFSYDSAVIEIRSITIEYENAGNGAEDLDIVVKSDTPLCFVEPTGIFAMGLQYQPFTFYLIQGAFYDPKVVGKIIGPASCNFGNVRIDSLAKKNIALLNDSLGQYRQVKTLSVDSPFILDDTIEMMYFCENNSAPNCYFHPSHAGHYVDTAKLLDELTKDTLSVVLIGDAYDAGVSEAATPLLKLYPNPCDRELRVEPRDNGPTLVEIYNLFGERIYTSTIRGDDETIDCSQLPAGTYFASIRSRSRAWNRKLIVMH